MHVGIITYQTGHLKTFEMINKFLVKSYKITIFAFPFKKREIKIEGFQDRPFQLIDIDIRRFCENYNINYVEVPGWSDKDTLYMSNDFLDDVPDVYITCIAKIIPESFIRDRIILNVHPGLLPENRGLDAFKLSVINCKAVGITLHAIDQEIDRGTLIHRIKIPILESDSLNTLCDRAYKMECDLLANFDLYLSKLKNNIKITDEYGISKNRIPAEIDDKIQEIFEKNKMKLIELSR